MQLFVYLFVCLLLLLLLMLFLVASFACSGGQQDGEAASRLADRRSRLQLNTARSLLAAWWRTQRGLPLPKRRTGPDLTLHMHPGVGGNANGRW